MLVEQIGQLLVASQSAHDLFDELLLVRPEPAQTQEVVAELRPPIAHVSDHGLCSTASAITYSVIIFERATTSAHSISSSSYSYGLSS
jgi:hypothetical protein